MGKKYRPPSANEIIAQFDAKTVDAALALRSDPVLFAEHVCGFTPHRKQCEFLNLPIWENMHVMLPWGRQFGKSLITAIWIAWALFARKGFRAYIFSPSEDQSRQIFNDVRRIFGKLKGVVSVSEKNDCLHIGGEEWDSFCELVKIGHEGKLGRGRSTRGNGVIVYDEFAVLQASDTVKGNLTPIIASGGGEVILSSPGDPGSTLHQLYEFWKRAEQGNSRYRVIEAEWSDTDHLTAEWVEDQRAEYEARGALWQFEREVLGKWVAPANVWFPYADLQNCLIPKPPYNARDQFIWAIDFGGRGRSALVVLIARFDAVQQRLEVVECLPFFFEQEGDKRYYRNTAGANVLGGKDKWQQIEDILLDLRERYPPVWVGVDPATENSLSGRLANVYRFPIAEILIGGYAQKLKLYTALQAGIRTQKLVWNHSAITEQLRSFCPRRKDTGQYEFPSTNTDIVVCMVNLYQYLGQVEVSPFAVATGVRQSVGAGDAW